MIDCIPSIPPIPYLSNMPLPTTNTPSTHKTNKPFRAQDGKNMANPCSKPRKNQKGINVPKNN